jgi:hypothetical protein
MKVASGADNDEEKPDHQFTILHAIGWPHF